jgi:HSP20 family protein
MATGLTRWEPFAELAELRDRLDRAFGEMTSSEARPWVPRIDLVREKERLVLQAELPGIKPENVDLAVEDGVLTISGRREESRDEKDKQVVRRERRYGSFSRSIPLPRGVDPEQIEADYQDGVLEVSIPMPAEEEGKKIQIRSRERE